MINSANFIFLVGIFLTSAFLNFMLLDGIENTLAKIINVMILRSNKKSKAEGEVSPEDSLKYVIIRADRVGVFAGYLESITETVSGRLAIMREARRIYYWSGAATLSQLAIDGCSNPKECKFPEALNRIEISQVIEVIDCTKKAQDFIQGLKAWKE